MPENETVQVGTGLSTNMEAIRKIDFLERHKVAGPCELSTSFCTRGGEVFIRE